MELKPKTQEELEELREENNRLRELVARLIGSRIAEMVQSGEQSASAEDLSVETDEPRRVPKQVVNPNS